ncbi:hypothetical protein LIER_14168 [Lithospermum erythrorhizon]|uniref:Uncharacterized protein n=1 Tax=Lithospermum erythrorhizon TaxID=34254 RepID=A0AAV3PY36_LITER
MIGQNKLHDESQGLLFDYGYSNHGETYQSNMHPQGEASSSHMVKQFEGDSGIFDQGKSQNNSSHTFGGEYDTFENFIDYQYEAQIESFYKSWESPPNKDII